MESQYYSEVLRVLVGTRTEPTNIDIDLVRSSFAAVAVQGFACSLLLELIVVTRIEGFVRMSPNRID